MMAIGLLLTEFTYAQTCPDTKIERIPSEADVKENGIELGKMQTQMMSKIEELTLYIIQLKKENDEIKKKLNEVIK